VNDYVSDEKPIDILQIDDSLGARQAERLRALRAARSSDEVARRLTRLRTAAQSDENMMPHIYEAVKAYATVGEVCAALREVFGSYQETAIA
jgi:methylmalonyl-CoA mutase N-terminal domain/subunit